MNTTIQTWYDFVLQQMAAESYLNQSKDFGGALDMQYVLMYGSNNPAYQGGLLQDEPLLLGATRMTAAQATDFTTRYTVVSHLPNTASGFSATLMRDNDTGAYTLSMRSTEYFNTDKGGDWSRDGLSGADGEIGNNGFAFGQIASMESYYDHLKLGESYNATTGLWESDPDLIDFKSRFGANPTGGTLKVTGYSLSGSLATLFTELHPEVTQACVFNATGLGNISSAKTLAQMVADFRQRLADAGIDLSDPSSVNIYAPADVSDPSIKSEYQTIRDAIATEYGGLLGTGYTQGGEASLVDARITQLFGHGAHNDMEIVANGGIHVPAIPLFIEDQPNIQGLGPISWLNWLLSAQNDYGTTHSITLIADSLAVMSVFEKLGLDMRTAQGLTIAYNLLAGGANQLATGLIGSSGTAESNSLEKSVEALGKLLLGDAQFAALAGGTALPAGTQGGTFGNLANRTRFYDVLKGINTAIANKTYVIEPLVGGSASTWLQNAKDPGQPQRAMAYRYALVNGNDFAVTGFDYSTINTAGEIDLYDPATQQGQLTANYLKERAAFVERKIYYNLHDEKYDAGDSQVLGYNLGSPLNNGSNETTDAYSNEDTLWDDRTTAIKIQRVSTVTADMRRVVFGSSASETDITGENAADALFGNVGDDTLTGNGGNDYLEGGQGFDTYLINAGDGYDTILDSDGQGVVKFGAVDAKGSAGPNSSNWKQLSSDLWADPHNGIVYLRSIVLARPACW